MKYVAVLLLVVVLPTAWLHSGHYQLFPPIGWVDPGLYIHWFTSPVENASLVGLDYHGARLPFVLVGFALYHLLDPVTAQSCLVTAFYVLGLAGLYSLIAAVVNTLPARLVAHWMICFNPIWIAAFVQGYVDGPTIAFSLLALALLLGERVPPSRLALAGMWLALAVSTQPFGGGVAGLSAGAILAARMQSLRTLLKAVFWMALGMGLAIVLLGAAGTLVGMPFFYLGVSKSAMSNVLAGLDTNYTTPVASWLGTRFRLAIVPVTVTLLGLTWALPRARNLGGKSGHCRAYVASLTLLAVFFAFLIHSTFVFEYRFYASYLLLALVPSIVLLLARLEATVSTRTWWWTAAVVLGVNLLVAAVMPRLASVSDGWAVWPAMTIVFVTAASALATRPALGLILVATVLAGAATANDDTAPIFDRPGLPSFRIQQRQLALLEGTLETFGIAPGRFLIWFGRDAFTDARHLEPAELYQVSFRGHVLRLNTLDSLAAAAAGWDASSLGFSMPAFDDISRQNMWRLLSGSSTVVLLCAVDRECTAGVQTLTQAGFVVTMQRSADISVQGAPSFHIIAADVRRSA